MAGKAVLLVLAVSEPGLRSALAAQLTLAGLDIVTVHHVDDPALRRSVSRPAILILDGQTVAAQSARWLAALLEESHWRELVVLTEEGLPLESVAEDPRLTYLDQANARAAIAALVPLWRTQDGADPD